MFCLSEQTLITADYKGLHASKMKTAALLWTTDGSVHQSNTSKTLTSLSTNGRGLLFAVDHKMSCVQMFSAVNGHYLGCLIRESEFGMGHPLHVNWCENTSTLILVHLKEECHYISFLKMAS